MKRDMEIIRSILLNVEEDKYSYGERIYVDGVPNLICAQHAALILDAGLAEERIIKTDSHGITFAQLDRLTSAGHDFCDAIRQDTIWNKAKEHILKPGASYGLSVLIEYVKIEVRKQVFGG